VAHIGHKTGLGARTGLCGILGTLQAGFVLLLRRDVRNKTDKQVLPGCQLDVPNRQKCREEAAILALRGNFAPDADDVRFPGLHVVAEKAIVPRGEVLLHQQ